MLDPMSIVIFFPALLITILALSNYTLFAGRSRPAKAKTPCPQSFPVIGNLLAFLRNRHRFHDWVSDMLAETPGSTLQVRGFLGLSRGVCTADPRNVEHLLHANFPNYVKGARFRNVLRELLGRGIFNVDAPIWTVQRKIASHEFNTRSLKRFVSETVASEVSNRLIPLLSKASDDPTHAIDLQDALQKLGFDNICNVAFGVDPACLSLDPKSSKFAEAFDDAVRICWSRFMSPLPLVWKVKRFFNIGSEKRLREAVETIDDFAMEIIRLREEKLDSNGGDDDQNLLSRFMSSIANMEFRDREEKREFLRDIVISFILAGRDSTSTALTWFFWLISAHPRCADAIRRELSEAREASAAAPGDPEAYDELKRLNYLHAALSETLRLFPPVPINSRLVLSDDVLPDGTAVAKGWFADYSAYAMGRSERLWGPDCREFRPERWLDGEGGSFRPRDPFRFPVFHGGPRMCLGRDMAYVQMKSIAAAVMSEFEITAVDGGGSAENMANPPYVFSMLLKMKGGLFVKVKRKKSYNATELVS